MNPIQSVGKGFLNTTQVMAEGCETFLYKGVKGKSSLTYWYPKQELLLRMPKLWVPLFRHLGKIEYVIKTDFSLRL